MICPPESRRRNRPEVLRRLLQSVVFILAWQGVVAAQDSWSPWVAVSGGMGISALSSPSVVDYANAASQASSRDKVSDFFSVTEFAFTPEVRVAEQWSVGADYMFRIKSLAAGGAGGQSQFEISSHHLGFVAHYLIEGESYLVRLGGGGAVVLGSFSQALFGSPVFSDFSARGGSVKVEVVGDTKFDDHLYGTIGADMRWVFGQTYHDGNREVRAGTIKAGLSSFALGLKLGILVRL